MSNNKKTENATKMRETKKKKNTYVVHFSALNNLEVFEYCDTTPMRVVTVNGKSVQNISGWASMTQFPNPGAHNMVTAFKKLQPIMGEKLASTIVEYLDKDTYEPVAMLFPTNEIMCRTDVVDFMKRLNHASRKDLNRQIQIRDRMMRKMLENNKQK